MYKSLIAVGSLIALSACTSVNVDQVDKSHNMTHVCIKDNPKVIVHDFIGVVEDVFQKHLITTEIYSGKTPENCQYTLTYTALRSWDMSAYLSHAELRLFKDNRKIGYAEYHLNGKGGLSLTKWASVKSKMTPVVNELLSQY